MACRQGGELDATGLEKHAGTDRKSADLFLGETGKGGLDVVAPADGEDFKRPPDRGSRRSQVYDLGVGIEVVHINERCKPRGSRQQLMQEPKSLGRKFQTHPREAREVPARSIETCRKTKFDWVPTHTKDDRNT